MNKLVYTGPTCYLGQYHFTRGKIYEIYHYGKNVFYIVADNAMHYHINMDKKEWNRNFITLDKWRELQINKILTYE